MPVDFDMQEFKKCLREQFHYILSNESSQLLEETLNELVRERLEELTETELNLMGSETEKDFPDAVRRLADVRMHISSLDIDHRLLVRQVLKKEIKKLLKGFVDENFA